MRSPLPSRLALVIATLSVSLLAGPARADDAGGSARTRALTIADEAAAAYGAGRLEEAVAKFEEAYRTFPAAPLLSDLSHVELKLGRCEEALEHAREYVALPAGGTTAAAAKSGGAWLAHVESQCTPVTITSTPAGATLVIEGVPQTSPLVTPWKGRLPVGMHSVGLTLAGFAEQRVSLKVPIGPPVELAVPLAPAIVPLPQPEVMPLPEEPVATVAPPAPVAPPLPPVSAPPEPAQVNLVPVPASAPAVPVAATSPARGMSMPRKIGVSAAVIGGVAIMAAAVLGVTVRTDTASLSSQVRPGSQAQSMLTSIGTRAISADVLFGVGGVLAATGVGLAIAF